MALSLERDSGCKISTQRKFKWQRASPTKFVGLAAASWAWAKLTSTLQRGFYPLAYPPVVTPPCKSKKGAISQMRVKVVKIDASHRAGPGGIS